MRHYADLIVRAEHEVFIATNYWEDSHCAALVSDSLRVLSKRCLRRASDARPVVKLIYDRGTPKQALHNHVRVPPDAWAELGLPRAEELGGIRFEVVNYHRPPLGTFHAKYLVVDRAVACLNSNNIQDRPNVEMMIHFEGPIVDSFYDVALFSWANALDPPLPLLAKPPVHTDDYKFGWDNAHLKYIDTEFSSQAARTLLGKQQARDDQQDGRRKRVDGFGNAVRTAVGIHPGDAAGLGTDELIDEHPAMNVPEVETPNASRDNQGEIEDNANDPPDATDAVAGLRERPRDESQPAPSKADADSSAADNAAESEPPADAADAKNGQLGPELLKSDYDDAEKAHQDRVAAITTHLNATKFDGKGTVPDDASLDDFRPHMMHAPHAPVPIAMVNRAPKGTPGHESTNDVPQNIAWLSAFKYAERSIFIQTPTFNASPVIPATLDACRRGVDVTLYLDLGFNDLGEMIPFQGGTNEQVINSMYKTLNAEGKQDKLKVYWYTAKDQSKPMSAAKKARNCHVKFMAVDDCIAIAGNGNQDTQSWFHSQEVNVLVDSPALVAEWRAGIDANQNTRAHGLVDPADGVWRAPDGRVVESSGTKTSGLFGSLKGISGAIRRVRGTGGF
ncbi:hypothetical protein EW145_g7754 [Phellinidium pouzarii]|uniref:PLD phosphodiesterase domain-containing protein n=1 Tax=Phellinidium pouzarii TaxID=167371 RepID=A0A4S4KEZ7_9AGAM|nr:hypothetical protein EW145_g7754 [Phellinidium pouzarii]